MQSNKGCFRGSTGFRGPPQRPGASTLDFFSPATSGRARSKDGPAQKSHTWAMKNTGLLFFEGTSNPL